MEVLLALFLDKTFSSTKEITPTYQVNICYKSNSNYRSNIIQIVNITDTSYNYKVYHNYKNLWGENLEQNFSTIESIYTLKTPCP